MNTNKIRKFLKDKCGHIEYELDPKSDPLPSLPRGEWDRVPTAGIGGDLRAKAQISSLDDAIDWCRVKYRGVSVLRLVIGDGNFRDKVFEALATLLAARRPGLKPSLEIMLDGMPTTLPPCPTFEDDEDVKSWMVKIDHRFEEKEPKLVRALSDEVDDPSFRWYLGVNVSYWSGRAEGLEVCRVYWRNKEWGRLRVGLPGRDGNRSQAGEVAKELLKCAPEKFTMADVKSVAKAIRNIVESRKKGGDLKNLNYQPEHFYEALILRGELPILPGSLAGAALKPAFGSPPFQFPAKWYTEDKARYVDILMRRGKVPWVVELKYAKCWDDGRGQYFRHAVSQAVLYREFIRKTPTVRDLLQDKMGLDATACMALVALACPKPSDKRQLNRLNDVAADFDVEVWMPSLLQFSKWEEQQA